MHLSYALLAVTASLAASLPLLADEPITVTKIWDAGHHNAFTDLVEWRGDLYCTFRESKAHVPSTRDEDGKVRILRSTDDGATWQSVALLAKTPIDLRDPKLSVTPDDRLMVLMGGSYYDNRVLLKRVCQVAFLDSPDGEFSEIQPVEIDPAIRTSTDWLWRVTWSGENGYGVVYQANADSWGLHLVETTDGVRYQLVKSFDLPGKPNEATVRFTKDGQMRIVVRNEDGQPRGQLGASDAPYTDWRWTDIDMKLGGPELLILPDGTMLLGTRDYRPGGARTVICRLDKDGHAEQLITLPSGGDTSYPGMLVRDRRLFMSYYASHEGKTSVYLAVGEVEELMEKGE